MQVTYSEQSPSTSQCNKSRPFPCAMTTFHSLLYALWNGKMLYISGVHGTFHFFDFSWQTTQCPEGILQVEFKNELLPEPDPPSMHQNFLDFLESAPGITLLSRTLSTMSSFTWMVRAITGVIQVFLVLHGSHVTGGKKPRIKKKKHEARYAIRGIIIGLDIIQVPNPWKNIADQAN